MVVVDQEVQIRLLLTESAVYRKSHPGKRQSYVKDRKKRRKLIKIEETLEMVRGEQEGSRR